MENHSHFSTSKKAQLLKQILFVEWKIDWYGARLKKNTQKEHNLSGGGHDESQMFAGSVGESQRSWRLVEGGGVNGKF